MLVPLGVEHARALYDALRNPELYRYIPTDAPATARDLEARYRRTFAGPAAPDERWWNWAVAGRESPAVPFGTVETSLSQNGANAQIAYVFGLAAWGRGYAREACEAVLAYLGERARTTTIEAYIDTRNTRSIRLVERLGLERVETISGADYFKGSPSDEYHYRLSLAADEVDDAQAPSR